MEIFVDSDETYGYRRVHAELARQDIEAGLGLVRALMRRAGPVACPPRPWRHCLTDGGDGGAIADLVARNFTADAPEVKPVGDVTYIPTWETVGVSRDGDLPPGAIGAPFFTLEWLDRPDLLASR